jgi:hypothetical protein
MLGAFSLHAQLFGEIKGTCKLAEYKKAKPTNEQAVDTFHLSNLLAFGQSTFALHLYNDHELLVGYFRIGALGAVSKQDRGKHRAKTSRAYRWVFRVLHDPLGIFLFKH